MNNSYQQAIHYIKEERMAEAEQLLARLYSLNSHEPNVKYVYGLAKAATGHVHEALQYWEKVDETIVPSIRAKIEKLKKLVPIYEKCIEQYNIGLNQLQQKEETKAYATLRQLIEEHRHLPLPIVMYKAYMLASIVAEPNLKIDDIYQTLPLYAQQSAEIKKIRLLAIPLQQCPETKPTRKKSAKTLRLPLAISLCACAVIIGGLMTRLLMPQTIEIVTEAENKEDVAQLEDQLHAVEEEMFRLSKENAALAEELERKQTILEEQEKMATIVELSSINLDQIAIDSAKTMYQKGIRAFQQKEYKEAIAYLSQSLALHKEQYFSDDAFYYLIQAKQFTGEDISDSLTAFFAETSNHYLQSPYRDDLYLVQGEYYLQQGNLEKAKDVFTHIEQEYENEWTAERARYRLAAIFGG